MYHTTTRAHRVLMAVLTEMNRQVMTVGRLAELWGVEEAWAAGRLSGKKGLTGSELGHIARALRVPVEQLDTSLVIETITVTPSPRMRSMVLAAAGLPDLLAGD